MVKTAQSVAHRLKEDESSDESSKEAKPVERNHIGVQDVGVKVSEGLHLERNQSLSFLVSCCWIHLNSIFNLSIRF